MESRRHMPEPWLLPVVEHWGTRYVEHLKSGHFRHLSSPFEVVEFESDRGKEMWARVGVVACS